MKKAILGVLLCLLTVGAWADSWAQNGAKWSTPDLELSAPKSMKAVQDKDGLLTLDTDDLRVVLTAFPLGTDAATIEQTYLESLNQEFKGLSWGQLQTSKMGNSSLRNREGRVTVDGILMQVKLSVLSQENHRLAVMSVQLVGDKASAALTNQVVNSVRFR